MSTRILNIFRIEKVTFQSRFGLVQSMQLLTRSVDAKSLFLNIFNKKEMIVGRSLGRYLIIIAVPLPETRSTGGDVFPMFCFVSLNKRKLIFPFVTFRIFPNPVVLFLIPHLVVLFVSFGVAAAIFQSGFLFVFSIGLLFGLGIVTFNLAIFNMYSEERRMLRSWIADLETKMKSGN